MFLIGQPSFSTNNVAYPDPPPFQEANMCPVFPVSNNSKMFPQCVRQPFPWRQPVHGARWRISRGCPTTASSPCWCGSSSAAPSSPSWSIKRLLLQSPACCVDRVTKETIARHLASNHPGHHRPSVDPDPGFSKHPDMLCGRTIPFDTIAIACKKEFEEIIYLKSNFSKGLQG